METMIAVQMYTLRRQTQTLEGIEDCFKRIADMGWKAAQMSAWGDVDDHAVKELADRYGLVIPATHIAYDKLIDNVDAVIEQHKVFDTPYVGLGMMPRKFLGSEEGYRAFVASIEPVAKAIRDAGKTFIYHNHNFEFERFGDKTGMDLLMELTDPDWFQFEMDTYWVTAGGGDPAAWIQKLKGPWMWCTVRTWCMCRSWALPPMRPSARATSTGSASFPPAARSVPAG